MSKYKEYKQLNLTEVANEENEFWKANDIFQKSMDEREGSPEYVFYDGPPSANGKPGIHHVISRTLKDLFCRYQTQKGKQVIRKAGWDTHGLPVELKVEKELGITKEDIGTKISVAEYNEACRQTVMQYTEVWDDLTDKMGYWVDMEEPYVTYKTKYIESVWWLLKQLHDKDMLYKGYTIQPYSPKAGTGLSSHELNLPGTYVDVKDTTVVAQFNLIKDDKFKSLFNDLEEVFALAWTTTPWTLPSNTALAVGPKIEYVLVKSFNQYTFEPMHVLVAKALVSKAFSGKYFEGTDEEISNYAAEDKKIPYQIVSSFTGTDLVDLKFEQLLPYVQPMESPEEAFRIIPGDFVTTEDGTGIVHIAPTFGADDAQVAKAAGVPPMLIEDENGNPVPLVDLQGRFVSAMGEFAGKYVKNEYYNDGEAPQQSVDVEIAIKLKTENRAFKVEKYEHSYPHCWRTDKPILYYPLDSWFVRATAKKERMSELNDTINWKPKATGTGRFGNWLKNLNDWNLSRSRYWGIPLPIWQTEEGDESICIGSVEQLKNEIDKSVAAGIMDKNPYASFEIGNMSDENYDAIDLHRPYADDIVLVSSNGEPMKRESDLIDVWFDSGSMPYAQWHYPFENKEKIDGNKAFPADFIAEGVDQTRGWFYTLHAIGTMVFDSVAYKNVISNGLVLDKNGVKMSKRLGNTIDPFDTLKNYGPDATRWYMITNAQPWDNLKFDLDGITEIQRKFFRALQNTYSFFTLYANVDGFTYAEGDVQDRPEIDQWILSKLNSLVKNVDAAYSDYEPTKAGRLIQEFVVDHLSNWHVRLSRKRFWRGDYGQDKISAYQTLYMCLETIAKISAPIAPFYSDRLFKDLNAVTGKDTSLSVHLALFPEVNEEAIDLELEERMELAQKISSMILSLRKRENLRVRQPLQKVMIPVLDAHQQSQIEAVADLIKTETNIKEVAFMDDASDILVKNIKPNFKTLGPKFGKHMKAIAQAVGQFTKEDIQTLESQKEMSLDLGAETITISLEDVEISTQDIEGWLVMNDDKITVALDITISTELHQEGIARELVNRIQNIRKDNGFEVTDKINIAILKQDLLKSSVDANLNYICSETLTNNLTFTDTLSNENAIAIELEEGLTTQIAVSKI
ncbi:isoleucine--tRNA ligase [bacterium SCSIO 12643]|nr:isoleucine--tRNA ligase [bacterium SCSIO 12643]